MSLSVIKVGGAISGNPGALTAVGSELMRLSRSHQILVVPGGGPFADAVREFDSQAELSAHAAHWMAILGMDQYAHVLADRIPGAVLLDEPGEIRENLSRGQLPILAPYRWMRSADTLPHSWDVSSDSIAAFVAGALGADRLALIKPAEGGDLVDPYFETALPVGLPWITLSWKHLEVLGLWLSGRSAAALDQG